MWRRRNDPERKDPHQIYPGAEALVEECEAFLSGDSVDQSERRGQRVPVWAWMNVLAHGTEVELRALATDRSVGDEAHQALAYVAGELVDLADDGYFDLETYQREVLVPLELDVLACPTTTARTAAQLASGLLRLLPARSNHRS